VATRDAPARANGEPGAVAICSSIRAADAMATRVAETAPSALAVHHPLDVGPSVVRATGEPGVLLAAMAEGADLGLHETASRPLLRHRRTWELGATSPGVTSLYRTRTRDGLSPDDYHRWWEREHGPRAVHHHIGMWDYTQVSVVRTLQGEPIDGVAVVQWPRRDELEQRFTDGPAGTAVIREDASRFTDLARLDHHLASERILVDLPLPGTGTVHLADGRHLTLDRSADAVWEQLGRFDRILDWWPGGFGACESSSRPGIGATRTLVRDDGTTVVERLVHHRPEERMLQLVIDEGLPPGIDRYTCRYEVRPLEGGRCRLDWYPRAVVDAGAVELFGQIVDRGWSSVSGGLAAPGPGPGGPHASSTTARSAPAR